MSKKLKNGIFTISLDFELYWGVMPSLSIEDYEQHLNGTRDGINQTLSLFKEFDIHTTWATVGFLFFNSREELETHLPLKKPLYENNSYNSYGIIPTINHENQSHFFALQLIKKIAETPFQEIGTHTYSHYFCLENGQTQHTFREDMKFALEIAAKFDFKMESIVFPRNQYNEEYLKICKELGVVNIRGNQDHYIYAPRSRNNENLLIRGLRLLDAYVNISGYNTAKISYQKGVVNIPASRFLRPFNPKMKKLENLRLQRIKNEMTRAAKINGVYHLWWHPHNFGKNVKENISFLKEILEHYNILKHEYGFSSLNMKEIRKLSINE